MELACDVLIVGGGCGGVAAALAATDLDRAVILTDAGSWIGGQLTSQAVPPDEHPWVESAGITARYRRVRDAVRRRYKQTRRLTAAANQDVYFNPGAAWVSNLSAEPEVFRSVLQDLLQPAQARGLLRCLLRHRPVNVVMIGDHVAAVGFENSQTGDQVIIQARYVLDATEEGGPLPLAGCESVVGAESSATTGEPHALDGPPDPFDQQAITWCTALEWRPGEDHVIDQPEGYEFWRNYRPEFWPGPQLGWQTQEPETGEPLSRALFSPTGDRDLWTFRRIRYGGHYVDEVPDVTLVNWPQVDYWLSPLVGVSEAERRVSLAKARELTLCLCAGCKPMLRGRTVEPDIPVCSSVRKCSVPQTAWRRQRTYAKAVVSPPNSRSWRPTWGLRLVLARIAPRHSRTRLALVATELIFIRAPLNAAISIFLLIRFRYRWAPCCRSDWTTCWQPVSAWASLM
jgi:FAD dependent oxidoreductase